MSSKLEAYLSQKEVTGKNSPRRQQAIDAAAEIFSRLGYHGASTRAIAETLGIKVASLYFHIASKEDALAEVCILGMERPLKYLSEALRDGATLAAQIRFFFSHQRDDLHDHADYVAVSLRERQHLGSSAQRRIMDLSSALRAELDEMFERAAEHNELNPAISPRQGRFIMIGTMRGISEMYLGPPIKDQDEIAATWVETLIRGITTCYVPPET